MAFAKGISETSQRLVGRRKFFRRLPQRAMETSA
jgi:hypothetical protein